MKKSLLFYKIFLPVTLGLTIVALTFNILSLLLTFDMDIGTVILPHPIPILFIVFITLAASAPIVLSILAKETKIITRTKSGSLFYKISLIILITALSALVVFDVVILVKELISTSELLKLNVRLTFFDALSQHFEMARLFRAILTIPFLAYLVFEFLGTKSKNTFVARAVCNALAILWCALTPVVFYFFSGSPPMTEYMRVSYSIAFILVTLFFLYDFKWNYLETNFRVYSGVSMVAAIFSLVLATATTVAVIARRDCLMITNYWDFERGDINFRYGIFDIYAVNLFEIIALLALGIFILSKVISIIQTVVAVAKSEKREETK